MHTYIVILDVEPYEGSSLADAIGQGQGELALRSYIERILPAGSPVTVNTVSESSVTRNRVTA